MPVPRWNELHWLAEDRVRLDGLTFRLTVSDFATPSTPDTFVFLKNRGLLKHYQALLGPLSPSRVFEIGSYHGGGLVFWQHLLAPERLVGLDRAGISDALLDYLQTHPASSVRAYYGLAQDDTTRLTALLTTEFPARNIDLVIDDCSHLYAPTRTCFATVFPWLRRGGCYVIEDWGWAHWPDYDPAGLVLGGDPGPPLTAFLVELAMIAATSPGVIASVRFDYYCAVVVRGPQPLPPGPLVLEDHSLCRGGPLVIPPPPRAGPSGRPAAPPAPAPRR